MSNNGKYYFNKSELDKFHENGYAGPFDLYEEDDMESSWNKVRRQLFDRSKAIYGDIHAKSGSTNIANYDRHLDVPFLSKHIVKNQIINRVESVLGPNVLCWRTEFFPKHPGEEGTDWHQADTFENISGTPQIVWPNGSDFGGTITVWCAFSDVTVDMAPLQFIPKTHNTMYYDESKGVHYDPDASDTMIKEGTKRGFFGYDYRELQIDPDWKPDESKAVTMNMKKGQFIMFWSTLMHASLPHLGKTDKMRMAFVSRYVPASVKVYPETDIVTEYGGKISLEKYGAVLVSGDLQHNENRMATHTVHGEPFVTDRGQPVKAK